MKKLLYSFFAIYITCTAKAQDAVDIWNLPPLNVEQGRYTTDWDNLSRQYNTPSWWREAKLGAWSHWDPQSMAEDGDWYSRGMYLEGHPQSKFHREHFGHPSEYGYKELCRDWKKHQSVVFTSNKLSKGKHDIQLKNKTGMVAIDAIIIQ